MAKRKTSSVKRKATFSHRDFLMYILVFALVGAFALWVSLAAPLPSSKGGPSHGAGSSCTITPAQVVLDQDWTVSATGLPTSNINQILTFPDGAQSSGPITVNTNGTYTTTGNSNMSASWGFIAPEQTGTYNYQFVGRIKWPAGTYTKLYASCSVVVTR